MIARLFVRYAMIASVAFAVIGTTAPASAQNAKPPSPAAMLIAKQILEVKGVKQIYEPIARGAVERAKQVLLQTNFMQAKELNEVAVQMHRDYDARADELVDISARIYASRFTESELRDILTFYQSPLGRKVIAEEPKALEESMTNAGNWADRLSTDVMARMRAEMKKRGRDLQ
jgi:hypothetical protein